MVGMIESFFNPDEAFRQGEKPLQESWDYTKNTLNPYNQNGVNAGQSLSDAQHQLMNPQQMESNWVNSYQTSPYAQQLMQQNKAQGLDAASSMGLMGSSAALGNIQQGAGNIVSRDRQQYMQELMQKYLAGLGVGQNLYSGGLQSAGQLAQASQNYGQNMAGLKYGEQAAPGQLLGKLGGLAGDLALNYATGGLSGAAKAASGLAGGGAGAGAATSGTPSTNWNFRTGYTG